MSSIKYCQNNEHLEYPKKCFILKTTPLLNENRAYTQSVSILGV
jgi:hypothetical protein